MQHHSHIFCGCPFFSNSQNNVQDAVLLFHCNVKHLKFLYMHFDFEASYRKLFLEGQKNLTGYLFPCLLFSLQSFASWLLLLHPTGEAPETEGCFHDWDCQEQTLQETRCVIFLLFKPQSNSSLTKEVLTLVPSWIKGKIPLKGLCLHLFQSIT